ncbi:MAG: ABC transporter ATP-binding protein [Corynebacterium sp.]|nr:ABC transporter ATP-binding protein [Corynebacterium sp.]
MPLLQLNEITRSFVVGDETLEILKGINLTVESKEFVSIVGASGSGKSTLMNIIGMLDLPTSGDYVFNGVDVLTANGNQLADFRANNIGFVFQNFNLIGRSTAKANVEMAMMYAGVPRSERGPRAEYLLELVGMADRMEHKPNELSGGQKQRVAIARALANDPDLILADEPTGALDTNTGHMVVDLFHKLHEGGRTILFITHNMDLARETTRIVKLSDGLIISDEPNEQVSRATRESEEA